MSETFKTVVDRENQDGGGGKYGLQQYPQCRQWRADAQAQAQAQAAAVATAQAAGGGSEQQLLEG